MLRRLPIAVLAGLFIFSLAGAEFRTVEKNDGGKMFLKDGILHKVGRNEKGELTMWMTRFNLDDYTFVWYPTVYPTTNDTLYTYYEVLDSAQIMGLRWYLNDENATATEIAAHIYLNRTPGEFDPDTIDQFFPVPPTVAQGTRYTDFGDLSSYNVWVKPDDIFWFAVTSINEPCPRPPFDIEEGNKPYHSWFAGPTWAWVGIAHSFDEGEFLNYVQVRYPNGVVAISDPNWWCDTYATADWDTIKADIIHDDTLTYAWLHYTVDGVEDSLDIMSNITDPDSLTSGVWGLLPCSVTPPSEVSYWIEAGEEGKSGESKIRTFTVLTPEHPDADILLVDDTGYDIIIGGTDTVPAGAAYEEVLDSLEKIYEYWNVKEHRGIDSSVINYGWGDIVWAGGMPPFALPDPTDSTSFVTDHPVTVFLDNGGCIFFSAHRYFDFFFGDDTQRAFGPGMWVHDYMGLAVGYAENISDTAFLGVANDPITGDWAVDPFITNKWWESNSDGAAANPEAIDIFIGAQTSQTAGTRFCNTVNESKIVFLPWDYLAACASAEVLPYAIGLMDNVLGWFLVGVEEEHSPYVFALSQSHPNPFRNNTTILYEIPKNALVSLKVYDITGRTVRILENDEKNAGLHTISWDGRDDKKHEVPDGIYFYRLEAGENTATGKMVIMR